jgi:Spy/CpxP family protein refolding chaperone
MTPSAIVRARVLGSLVVALAFVAGVVTGMAVERRPRPGVNVTMTATTTNAMPRELEGLDLTESQRVAIRSILVRGRDRVIAVMRDFDPRMSAAVDSTNREIEALLTPGQRASLAEYRRDHPPMVNQRIFRKE